jgi:hypothetical protein
MKTKNLPLLIVMRIAEVLFSAKSADNEDCGNRAGA